MTGPYVFIDMDAVTQIRLPITMIPGNIHDFQFEKGYKLIGIGKYQSGHYTALFKLCNVKWVEIDNLWTLEIYSCLDENTLIQPHFCVYQKV